MCIDQEMMVSWLVGLLGNVRRVDGDEVVRHDGEHSQYAKRVGYRVELVMCNHLDVLFNSRPYESVYCIPFR